MDIFSYKLGKKSSGGGGSNDYFISTQVETSSSVTIRDFIKTISSIDVSNRKNLSNFFAGSQNLESVPLLDTSNATNMSSMFSSCYKLKDVPVFNTLKVNNMEYMFADCSSLTDESLNNILEMCTKSAITISSRKSLSNMGFTSTNYPATKIQGLSNYQDFISAGWSIGY